MIVSKIGSIN